MKEYSEADKIRIARLSDIAKMVGCGEANCNSCKHLEYDEDRCEDDEDDFGSICSKYIFGSGYLEDVPVNLLQEKPCWEPDFWDANLDGFEIGTNLTDQLKSEKKFNDFVASMMPTDAYCEYMSMANKLFEHIRNGTTESIEESVKIEKRQAELWEKMTDNEKIDADDTVLRTVIYLKAIREKNERKDIQT